MTTEGIVFLADLASKGTTMVFGRKGQESCAVCGKELGRHRYRPAKEWNMSGVLCADCHIDKTKAFMVAQQAVEDAPEKCAVCHKELVNANDMNKPKWQWEMESGLLLCKSCYQKKDADYNRKTNFCAVCNSKLGRFFYHPKPAWKIDGNLCRRCWDEQKVRER